jgi:hypothetical protein
MDSGVCSPCVGGDEYAGALHGVSVVAACGDLRLSDAAAAAVSPLPVSQESRRDVRARP